jgi:abnormal spindle-like microcephaly-associated protein
MYRYTAGTPCPAPNLSFSNGYYDYGRQASSYAPSYATDDTTANIEYTTEIKAIPRTAKPRRPVRTMHKSRASIMPEGSKIKRNTILAQPAQRIPKAAPPVQEAQPPKPHRRRVSHMLADRQGNDVNATVQLQEEVLEKKELRKQGPKKDPRRRTIYVPSDDTTMMTIHPGQFDTYDAKC